MLCVAWGCGSRTELRETNGSETKPSPAAENPDSENPDSENPDSENPEVQVLDCPTSPNDPRLPQGHVGDALVVDGADFSASEIAEWRWSVVDEGCDRILPVPRYSLSARDQPATEFRPARSGPYRLRLEVRTSQGASDACEFEVAVLGRGLRVELCWDTSTETDLDLYLHRPDDESPWYAAGSTGPNSTGFDNSTCNPANCGADLRLGESRVDWGYAASPAEWCDAFTTDAGFVEQGTCPNPRASTDNNQVLATGTAEVVQLDSPEDGQRFRVMVQNFDNGPATPHVYVYCGNETARYLPPPASPPNFQAPGGQVGFGIMWRPADVELYTNAAGVTIGCSVDPTPLGDEPYVTIDDPTY